MTGKLKQPNWVWVPSVALSELIREIVRQWEPYRDATGYGINWSTPK
jgi:hypothetical protein